MTTDLYLFDKTTVGSRLNSWALWKMDSGLALGYPSQASFCILRVDDQRIEDYHVPINPECMDTDAAVNKLPYVHYIVIRVEYLSGYLDMAVKSYKCGISKRTYYNYLEHAKELIAKNLNILLHDVHTSDINMV